ncbi:MAG: uncharacterized protein K0Q68_2700 [Moraxellaceae bacterium]|jgi:hypothetical protein|nr:uncharacterized protein [Moraxellaceae bacterium]
MRAFLIALLLLPAVARPAADPCRVGEVTRIAGAVSLQRDTRVLVPVTGTRLCQGDRFVTGPGSIAELRLRDGSRISVGKDSEFVIREYRIYRDRPNQALFELTRGAFRSITGFITKRSHRYEVRTPVGTIGVRGTDFWGGFGLTEGGLDVIMLEGKGVYVDTPAGRVELDKAGLGTTVVNGAAQAPVAWGQDKIGRAVATITP